MPGEAVPFGAGSSHSTTSCWPTLTQALRCREREAGLTDALALEKGSARVSTLPAALRAGLDGAARVSTLPAVLGAGLDGASCGAGGMEADRQSCGAPEPSASACRSEAATAAAAAMAWSSEGPRGGARWKATGRTAAGPATASWLPGSGGAHMPGARSGRGSAMTAAGLGSGGEPTPRSCGDVRPSGTNSGAAARSSWDCPLPLLC